MDIVCGYAADNLLPADSRSRSSCSCSWRSWRNRRRRHNNRRSPPPAGAPAGRPRAGQAVRPPPQQQQPQRAAGTDAHPARAVQRAGRAGGHAVGRDADAAQPDQHGHRPRRPDLGRRGRALPPPLRPPARGRQDRRARGHRQRRQGRQDLDVRAGSRPGRAARHRGHRQQDRGLAAARPDRLHRRRPQPASSTRRSTSARCCSPASRARTTTTRCTRSPSAPTASGCSTRATPAGCSPTSRARRSASFGAYRDGPVGPFKNPHDQNALAGKPSDDGHTYVGGFTVRMNPDGTARRDHRPQLPQQLRAVDQLARRRLPERQRRSAGVPRQLGDGVRQLRLLVERRPARLAGGSPAGAVDADGGVAPGRPGHDAGRRRLRRRLADRQRVLRERRARRGVGRHVPRRRSRAQRGLLVSAEAAPAPASRSTIARSSSPRTGSRSTPAPTSSAAAAASPARWRRCSARPTSRSAPTARSTSPTGSTRASAATRISTTTTTGAIYRIAPKGFVPKAPTFDANDDRRADHRAALAGDQRPRHRVHRA